MSISVIAALAGTDAVAVGASTGFTTTGPFVFYGDNFNGEQEGAVLYRLGPSGGYLPATDKDGIIKVKDYPNMVLVDTPGSFRVARTVSRVSATVGYEEV